MCDLASARLPITTTAITGTLSDAYSFSISSTESPVI